MAKQGANPNLLQGYRAGKFPRSFRCSNVERTEVNYRERFLCTGEVIDVDKIMVWDEVR